MFQAFLDWRYSYFLNEPTFASVFKAFPQIHFQENHIPYFQNWLSVKMWWWSLCVALSRGCPALWSSCVLVCLWVVCSMRFHGCTQGRRLSSSMWVGLFQSAEGLNKKKVDLSTSNEQLLLPECLISSLVSSRIQTKIGLQPPWVPAHWLSACTCWEHAHLTQTEPHCKLTPRSPA